MTQYIDIFNEITKYYPIGIDVGHFNYQEYNGSKLLSEILKNKMLPDRYLNKWKPFVLSFKDFFPELKHVSAETSVSSICYSGQLVISNEVFKSVRVKKSLIFHLSVINSFFCIYGRNDVSIITSQNIREDLIFDPIITISPTGVFEKYYNHFMINIKNQYPESLFVPYILLQKRVDGLSLDASLKVNQYGSVFQALFIEENMTDYRTQGNEL